LYSAAEKLKVLQYAELYGIRVAAHHFNINHSMISYWGKIEEKLKLAKGKNRHIGSGRKEKYPEAEASLQTWLINRISKKWYCCNL